MTKRLIIMGLLATHMIYTNQLKKVDLHTCPIAYEVMDSDPHIEIAKLSLSFGEQPHIQKLSSSLTDNNWQHEIYQISHANIDEQCQRVLHAINREKHAHYHIACVHNKEHQKITIDLHYDPTYLACYLDSFDAITHDKGIIFRFVNKKLLDELVVQEKPLIQVAFVHYLPIN